MLTEIKPSVKHAISLLHNLEKNSGKMENLFLSEVFPTGVFREVQLEKVEARKKTTKMIKHLFFQMEKLL